MIKKLIRFILCLILAVVLIFTTLGYFQYKTAIQSISIEDKVAQIQADENYVSLKQVSDYLKDATVAIEDRRFYEHHGVDFIAWLRIAKDLIFTQQINSGGSTITQQLAKNMYYTYQPSYLRKVSEIFTAYDLEKELSKKEILELYVNVINYGDNHIGIREDSEGYFHKKPKDLTLDEATLLAGLPQSPANYQLSNHEDVARRRQIQVLNAMVRESMINEDEKMAVIKQAESDR